MTMYVYIKKTSYISSLFLTVKSDVIIQYYHKDCIAIVTQANIDVFFGMILVFAS